jgi:hypothetical protein
MNTLPTQCPLCGGGQLTVTRIYCRDCDTTYEGRFSVAPFANLTPEQLNFLLAFIRAEGRISRMEKEIGLSYPTIRSRLQEVIRTMGYEPGGEEPTPVLSEKERQQVLEDLDAGRISAEEAMRKLREAEE